MKPAEIAARLVRSKAALNDAAERVAAAMASVIAREPGAAKEMRAARKEVDAASSDLKAAMKDWKQAADAAKD